MCIPVRWAGWRLFRSVACITCSRGCLQPPEMHSKSLIEIHFWFATIGVVLYIASMWIAGVMQGLMWRAVNADGTLTYTFVEIGQIDLPILCDPTGRWFDVPGWHVLHGLYNVLRT